MRGVEEAPRRADVVYTNTTEDGDIYNRYIEGDETAFEEILRAHRHGLIRYLYRCVGDLETAEELSEDCFVELFLHPGRYRREASLKNYLYAVARHKAASHRAGTAGRGLYRLKRLPRCVWMRRLGDDAPQPSSISLWLNGGRRSCARSALCRRTTG